VRRVKTFAWHLRALVLVSTLTGILTIFTLPVESGVKISIGLTAGVALVVGALIILGFINLMIRDMMERALFLETEFFENHGSVVAKAYAETHSAKPLTNFELWLTGHYIREMRVQIRVDELGRNRANLG
jgi:hypothetical protein